MTSATAAMRAPGACSDCHTSSAVLRVRAVSVRKSNVATDALTKSGNIFFHLAATNMGQEQSAKLTLHLHISLISFLAV